MHPIFHLLPDAPKPVAPYSHAVEAGPFVFVTGQLATDPDDDSLPVPPGIEAQTHKVMDNLARVLKGCGLSLADVVVVRIFLTDFKGDYARMNDIYATYFPADRRPARTTIGVTALARDGVVEIDMIAKKTVRDTMVGRTKAEISEANRRRYEELRAAGQEATPKALPPATAPDGAPIAPHAVISREEVPPGWYDTVRLRRGEALRIVDTGGLSSVSVVGWCEHDSSERINCADTAKVQWSAALSKGRVILSDMGRVFLSLIEDTSGAHDLLVGGSTPASALAAFGETSRNTHDNFLAAASKLGLGLRDIPPCVTFFAPVSLDAAGRFVWNAARKRPGDFVDLRAETDLVLVLSNCPHPLDPVRPAAAGPVTLLRHRAPPAAADDPCRTTSPEIVRAFQFTDRLYA